MARRIGAKALLKVRAGQNLGCLHTLRAKRDNLLFPDGGSSSRDTLAVERKGEPANATNSLTRHTFGRFSVRGPAAWRMRWRYGRKM